MKHTKLPLVVTLAAVLLFSFTAAGFAQQDVVKIALNYPQTGPFAKQGKEQWYAAEIARKEINDAGGILGKKIAYRWYDSASNPNKSLSNLTRAIDQEKVKMVFGGASSAVTIVAGEFCRKKNILIFGTLTYATATTGKSGHTHVFRECYNSWMAAKAIGSYLRTNYPNANYFYITADYTWGWSMEETMRKFTNTQDKTKHHSILTPFPFGHYDDVLKKVQRVKPDVLVITLGGQEFATCIRKAHEMGLKNDMQIVVPMVTLGMCERGTPQAMEGIIGAVPWCYKVPYEYNYPRGIEFVEKFKKRFNRYPSSSAASAYTIMHEYKAAVERAGTFDTHFVIKALEGHKYTLLKDEQQWRAFDHQSVQTVYTVRCNPPDIVLNDKYNLDYYSIIGRISGSEVVRTRAEWNAIRRAAGKPIRLQ